MLQFGKPLSIRNFDSQELPLQTKFGTLEKFHETFANPLTARVALALEELLAAAFSSPMGGWALYSSRSFRHTFRSSWQKSRRRVPTNGCWNVPLIHGGAFASGVRSCYFDCSPFREDFPLLSSFRNSCPHRKFRFHLVFAWSNNLGNVTTCFSL